MPPHLESTVLNVALVDVPGLIQSIATQRRSGLLTVSQRDSAEFRSIRFAAGQIQGVTGGDPETFGKSLVWSGVMTLPQYHAALLRAGDHCPPERLLKTILQGKLLSSDGVLDALDCYIVEEFTTVLGWIAPQLSFSEVIIADEWGSAQAKLGVSVNPGSLLLEALRRQDELGTVADLLPDPYDALFRTAEPVLPELSADARLLLEQWTDGVAAITIFDHPTLPPFRARLALGLLCKSRLVRLANVNELVVEADAAYAKGQHQLAYGLYRRALAHGLDNSRIHMHIAELAERFQDRSAAAASYMAAAQQLLDPNQTVVALRNALRLGADQEAVLTQLVALHVQLGNPAETVSNLLSLAEIYTERGNHQQAMQSVREAQSLGADRAETALLLARYARRAGDQEQAALQLELAARAYHENDRIEEAIGAWRELLVLQPSRSEYAKECAELLVWNGQKDEAIQVLRDSLVAQHTSGKEVSEDVLVQMHELLSRLDPSDAQAHDFLASAYERRRDRDGASKQLKLSAQAQERAGDFHTLAATLTRLLEIGTERVETSAWLARTRVTLRQERLAAEAWCDAIDAGLALGRLKDARKMAEAAVQELPGSLPLRERLAQIANREGDRPTATKQFIAAADLASGSGAMRACAAMLVQVCRLKPDDLTLRLRLAAVAEEINDPALADILAEIVRVAVRSANFGLALEYARKRIVASPAGAYEARLELIELLRLSGDTAGQLAAGRQLLDDLLQQGEFEKGVEVLSRLVASHPKNSELVMSLAEVYNALGDARQAFRFYKHAVPLLQLDDKLQDARAALRMLETMCSDDERATVQAAHERLTHGQVIDWEAIRKELEQGQRRKAVGRVIQPGLD